MPVSPEDYAFLKRRPIKPGTVPWSIVLRGTSPDDDIQASAQEDLKRYGIPDTVIFARNHRKGYSEPGDWEPVAVGEEPETEPGKTGLRRLQNVRSGK